MGKRRTYYPSKVFDERLKNMVRMLADKGLTFPCVSAEQLAADSDAQREERAEHDAARRSYLALHETFGLAQLARYQRFMAVLEAMRGIFREDKAVMAELDEFSRAPSRSRKASEEDAA
jgi:hypothetical protein